MPELATQIPKLVYMELKTHGCTDGNKNLLWFNTKLKISRAHRGYYFFHDGRNRSKNENNYDDRDQDYA